MKNNYNFVTLTMLIGYLALSPLASFANELEIFIVKHPGINNDFLYTVEFEADKFGATTFELVTPSATFNSIDAVDDSPFLNVIPFSSLSSEIANNWTLTWDDGLNTETVASIGFGTILESDFLEVPTITNPIDGATGVPPNTSIDWVYSVAPTVAQQDFVEVFGLGPELFDVWESGELPLDSTSFMPASALSPGEWDVIIINGKTIRFVADGIGGPITGDPWVLDNEDWLDLVSVDIITFLVGSTPGEDPEVPEDPQDPGTPEEPHGPGIPEVIEVLAIAAQNPTQSALATTVGTLCPQLPSIPGNDLIGDLSDRCTFPIVAAFEGEELSLVANALQDFGAEEGTILRSTQVEASATNVGVSGHVRGLSSGAVANYNMPGAFNWSSGAAGDGDSRWSFFLNGLYTTSDQDTTATESGFDSDDFGVTVGFDYAVSDTVVLGVAFAYKTTDADVKNDGGSLETENYGFYGYGSFTPDEHWYFDAMFGYVTSDHEQVRNIQYLEPGSGLTISQRAGSETDSEDLSLGLAGGYNFIGETWIVSPYARLDYGNVEVDAFVEEMSNIGNPGQGLALSIDDQEFDSLTSTLGISFTGQWDTEKLSGLFPYVLVEYVHEFENDNDPIVGRFVNDPNAIEFSLPTAEPDEDYFNIGVGITAAFTDTTLGFIRYQGLFGYRNLDVHGIEVGIRQAF